MKNDCEDERGQCVVLRGVSGYDSGTIARELRAGLSLLPEGDKCTMANRLRKLSPCAIHGQRLEDGPQPVSPDLCPFQRKQYQPIQVLE
jgi:hypothetical protein